MLRNARIDENVLKKTNTLQNTTKKLPVKFKPKLSVSWIVKCHFPVYLIFSLCNFPSVIVAQLGVTFSCTKTVQTYTLPAGVASIAVTAAGAQGGQAGQGTAENTQLPGLGGIIDTVIGVASLATLYVYVGGAGNSGLYTNTGGFNGGGTGSYYSGNNPYTWGGGGGGASDVRTIEGDLSTRLVVAGGGGGWLAYITCAIIDEQHFRIT